MTLGKSGEEEALEHEGEIDPMSSYKQEQQEEGVEYPEEGEVAHPEEHTHAMPPVEFVDENKS